MSGLRTKYDSTGGEGGNVGHDDLRVMPGHVGPAQVLHGDDEDVGEAGGGAAPQPHVEEERTDPGHDVTLS